MMPPLLMFIILFDNKISVNLIFRHIKLLMQNMEINRI